jgi:DNA repair exonuclease SbcCD ATPase subunit
MFREHVNEAVRDHIVRAIPDPVKQGVLTLWLNGSTYQEIAAQAGLSPASISNIIADYRKRMPDLEDLRRLRSDLREAKATLGEAMRGARLLRRLDMLDLEREDLSACLKFVSTAGKRVSELASAGSKLLTLEQQTGKTYDRIVLEFEQKSRAEADMSTRVKSLEERELALKNSIHHLEKLEGLQQTIERHSLTPPILERLISDGLGLQGLGFTTQHAQLLAKELAKSGLDPAAASAKIAQLLQEYLSLEEARKKAQEEANAWTTALQTRKTEVSLLQNRIENAPRELQQLEDSYTNRTKQLEGQYRALEAKLKAEYDSRKQELESRIRELEGKADTLTREIKEMEAAKKSIAEAEAALQRIKADVQSRRLLGTITSLVEDRAASKGHQEVAEAMVAILKGFEKHLETSGFLTWKDRGKLRTASHEFYRKLVEELS